MAKVRERLDEFRPDTKLIDERGATRERTSKRGVVIEIGDLGTQTIRQSPVERALARKLLTEEQGRAAEKLYLHWWRSGLASGPTQMQWGGSTYHMGHSFNRLAKTEAQVFHRDRLRAALDAVKEKSKLGGCHAIDAERRIRLLEYVVCRDLPVDEAGMKAGFALQRGAAMMHLSHSLNILVSEWGLS